MLNHLLNMGPSAEAVEGTSTAVWSGKANIEVPMRKCPGVKT